MGQTEPPSRAARGWRPGGDRGRRATAPEEMMATAFRTRREPRVHGRATPRRPAERRAFAHLPRRVSGLPGPGASERAAVNVARGPACGRGWPPPQAGATERECRQSALTLDTAPGGRASSASIVPTPVCGTPPEAGGKRRAAGTPLLSSRASGDGDGPAPHSGRRPHVGTKHSKCGSCDRGADRSVNSMFVNLN